MMHKSGFTLLGEMLHNTPIRYEFEFDKTARCISFFEHPWKHGALYSESPLSSDLHIDHSFESNTKKIIIFDKISLYHLFIEILPAIVDILINYKDVEIIFNINQSNHFPKQTTFDFLRNFSGFLNSKYDNRITIIGKIKDFNISINNYVITDSGFHLPEPESVSKTRELLLEFLGVDAEPTKKIYLSRKKAFPTKYPEDVIRTSYMTNDRIVDEENLELFLAKQGFEIIVPEQFDSMVDQLRYLSKASVLVSSTSSGLGNMIVMTPGTSVVEVVSTMPLMVGSEDKKHIIEVFHNQYGPSCVLLNINSARIPNVNREAKAIIENIKSSKSLQGFLQIDRIVE